MKEEGVYRTLLRILPPRLRSEHGAELMQAFRDREREVDGRRFRTLRLWSFLALDMANAAAAAWRHELGRMVARRGARTERREGKMMIETLVQDLAYALRSFRRHMGFAVTAVVTLALGVGATTTIWSVVDGVLLSPLPYPESDRLVQVGTHFRSSEGAFEGRLGPLSPVDIVDVQTTSTTVASVAASRLEGRILSGEGEPEQLSTAGVSAEYFTVLGVEPAVGRAFTKDEDAPDGAAVTVLSHDFWYRRFGADPAVLGRTLHLGGTPFTVVGIMGPDFHPPEAIHHQDVALWYPFARVNDDIDDRGSFFVQGIARLAPGASLDAAQAELAALGDRLSQAFPDTPARRLGAARLHERTVGDVGRTLWMLLGGVGALLVIACANVANLLLVRATERAREMAVRAALGAGRRRILRQFMTEGLVLALCAGVVAVGLAHVGVEGFRRWSPGGIPRLAEVGVDPTVLALALLLSSATGVLFTLAPAMRTLRQAEDPLREHGSGSGREGVRTRSLLIIVQTAVALVLFTGAGLLLNSFVRLQHVDPGFELERVAWLRVYLQGDAYATPEARATFFGEMLERAGAIGGVEAVGGTDNLPLSPNRSLAFVSPRGLVLGPDEDPPAVSWHMVFPGTFEALGIPILQGRDFTDRDGQAGATVALVNQAAAELLWPGQDPVGQSYVPGRPESGSDAITVVGVVPDVRHQRLANPPEPEMYLPALSGSRVRMNLLVRTAGDPAAALEQLREAVWSIDSGLPLPEYGTLSEHAADSILEPRFYTLLLSTFAAVALVLALVGVYGTLAYTVELRTRELGVRLALGARGNDVLALVLRRGMTLVGIGLVAGVVISLMTAAALERFLFGITPRDPGTLVVAAAAMAALALAACMIPALRAARLDPMTTLRSE